MSISRAFFCKRSEYLDIFIFWEIFIFGEIFILLIFLLQQVGIFIFWEIFIWRNIYLQTKFNSEKYLFNHGSQYFDSYNLYHGPGIWFVYILDCRSPLTERLICSDNEKTLIFFNLAKTISCERVWWPLTLVFVLFYEILQQQTTFC